MKQVVGTLFFSDGKIDDSFTTSEEIGTFMWIRKDDDINVLSNALKNEIILYCIKNNLIY